MLFSWAQMAKRDGGGEGAVVVCLIICKSILKIQLSKSIWNSFQGQNNPCRWQSFEKLAKGILILSLINEKEKIASFNEGKTLYR